MRLLNSEKMLIVMLMGIVYKELLKYLFTYSNVVCGVIIISIMWYGNAGKTRVYGLLEGRASMVRGGQAARVRISFRATVSRYRGVAHASGGQRPRELVTTSNIPPPDWRNSTAGGSAYAVTPYAVVVERYEPTLRRAHAFFAIQIHLPHYKRSKFEMVSMFGDSLSFCRLLKCHLKSASSRYL